MLEEAQILHRPNCAALFISFPSHEGLKTLPSWEGVFGQTLMVPMVLYEATGVKRGEVSS
jgi:hypothetical protein